MLRISAISGVLQEFCGSENVVVDFVREDAEFDIGQGARAGCAQGRRRTRRPAIDGGWSCRDYIRRRTSRLGGFDGDSIASSISHVPLRSNVLAWVFSLCDRGSRGTGSRARSGNLPAVGISNRMVDRRNRRFCFFVGNILAGGHGAVGIVLATGRAAQLSGE